MRWKGLALLVVVGCIGCRSKAISDEQSTAVTVGGDASGPDGTDEPVSGQFVDLTATNPGKMYPIGPCTEALVSSVKGVTAVAGEMLGPGDILAARQYGSFGMKGVGTALIVRTKLFSCDTEPSKRIVHAADVPELTFMKGTMHAHLDVTDRTISPSAYFGRLSGTAALPEHSHPGTWELICVSDGTGSYTLGTEIRRLGPKECVRIPPDTKHSWKPDPGTTLVATQVFWPPGPEQHYKELASQEPQPKPAASASAKDQ